MAINVFSDIFGGGSGSGGGATLTGQQIVDRIPKYSIRNDKLWTQAATNLVKLDSLDLTVNASDTNIVFDTERAFIEFSVENDTTTPFDLTFTVSLASNSNALATLGDTEYLELIGHHTVDGYVDKLGIVRVIQRKELALVSGNDDNLKAVFSVVLIDYYGDSLDNFTSGAPGAKLRVVAYNSPPVLEVEEKLIFVAEGDLAVDRVGNRINYDYIEPNIPLGLDDIDFDNPIFENLNTTSEGLNLQSSKAFYAFHAPKWKDYDWLYFRIGAGTTDNTARAVTESFISVKMLKSTTLVNLSSNQLTINPVVYTNQVAYQFPYASIEGDDIKAWLVQANDDSFDGIQRLAIALDRYSDELYWDMDMFPVKK